MKKIIPFVLALMIASCGFAQHCSSNANSLAPGTYSNPGLMPDPDLLQCRQAGQTIYDTIYFTNYTSISGQAMDSLTFDSIGNLPAGLCWTSNKASNTFQGGENGVILISGASTASPGQYKLKIFLHASMGVITLPPYTDAEATLGLRYYIKIACTNGSCLPVDTTLGKLNSYVPYTPSCTIGSPAVTASVTASGPTSFCQGGVVTLSANYDSSYRYNWSNGGNTPSINVSTTGNYTVTVFSGTDSAVSSPVSVSVNYCAATGFSPSSAQLPCIISGQAVNDTIFFNNYTTISGLSMDSMRFDSINNLPAGLNWTTNKPGNVFLGGDSGWIHISGTSTAASGQYKLKMKVSASLGASAAISLNNILLSSLTNTQYYIRMACTNGSCIAVDTSLGQSNDIVPYTAGCTIGVVASITAGGSTSICQGSNVALYGPYDSSYTYRWSTGANTSSIYATAAGSYSLTVYQGIDSAVATPVSVTVSNCTSPGFSPPSELLPCVQNNTSVSDTILFTNYSNLSGIPLDSLTFDSISNLPAGLFWSTSRPGNVFQSGDSGYLYIYGTPNSATPGQYKLKIIATLHIVNTSYNTDLESSFGLRYYIRVSCGNGYCSQADTINGVTNSFIADTSCTFVPTVTISPSGNSVFCAGSGVTLTAGGSTGCTYVWSTGATTASINVFTSGYYSVTASYGLSTASTGVNVTSYPGPTAAFTLTADATPHVWDIVNQCTGTSLSYTWNWGDSTTTTTTSPTPSHSYTTAGYYTVCVSVYDSIGCSASYCDSSVYLYKTDNQMIQLNVLQYPAGISSIALNAEEINYYSGAVHFSEAVSSPTDLKLYDLSGRVVMSQSGFTGSIWGINHDVAKGVYIIHLQNGNYSLSKKLMILQ